MKPGHCREELTPRKEGQARFAHRRATAWDALTPCRILEATVGSRAWGLAGEASDTDTRGIFALPLSWTVGLAEPPRDLRGRACRNAVKVIDDRTRAL